MRAEKKRLKLEKEKKKKKWDKPSLSQLGEILLRLGGAVYLYTTVFWDKIEATATYSAYNNDIFLFSFTEDIPVVLSVPGTGDNTLWWIHALVAIAMAVEQL